MALSALNSDRAGTRALESVKGLLRTIDGLPKGLKERSLDRLAESTALMNIELKLRDVHGLGSALSGRDAREAIADLKALDLKLAYRIVRSSRGAGFAVISDPDLRNRLIPGRWQLGSLGRAAVKSHVEVGLAALDIRQIRESRTSLRGDKTIMEDAIRAHIAVGHYEKAARYAMRHQSIRGLKDEFGTTVAEEARMNWDDWRHHRRAFAFELLSALRLTSRWP